MKYSVSINGGQISDQLSDCQLLTKGCVPWNESGSV